MPKMIFIERDGTRREVDAPLGDSVLEIARRHDIDIKGACEGSLACSTCHVIVDPEWYGRLREASEEEEDMLNLAFNLTRTSRLGCQFLGHDDLTAKARGSRQVEGEVEHVLLLLAGFSQPAVPFRIDDDVTGRAGERAFTGAFDVDVMAACNFHHRHADRRVEFAARSVALNKCDLRHHPGRGARSSASTAAASAGFDPAGSSDLVTTRNTSRPAPLAASYSLAAILASSTSARTTTACVTGRASARSARTFAAPSSSCHSASAAAPIGTGNALSKPSRSASTTALPPTETATSASAPTASMPIAAPGAFGSAGPPSGSSI